MNPRLISILAGALCAAPLFAADSATSRPGVTKYYLPATPADAKVVTATFLGGKGHEWLVGGGWQPSGEVILAGNVIGPLPGETGDVPSLDVAISDRGRVVALWNTNGATGFLAQCAPDLKKLVAVHRLPWPGAVVTAALVERGGAVYVAGLTDAKWFVGKIAADLKRAEWQRPLAGDAPPQLRLLPDGTLWVRAQDVQVLDATGKALRQAALPAGLSHTAAVNPRDGRIARSSNRGNWSTGREPWKCPGVRILNPDGTDLYYLYEWHGRYVGLDNQRSVADTSVGALNYDDDGNLFLYTWSDGGNTVMRYRSTDIRRLHGCQGLPFHWGGTGYNIVKLDGRDYQTIGSTQWATEHERGRHIMRMNTLLPLPNGTVCIAGIGGSRGVHETTTSLLPSGPTGGNYVTLLASDLASARFSTLVGGAGVVNVGHGAWGAVSGVVNGQQKVLLLTGAKAMNDTNKLATTAEQTPVTNAMQAAFGGGTLDGYAILLDLPAAPPPTTAPATVPRLNLASTKAFKKSTDEFAEAGTKFYFSPTYPKHATADVEIRDAKDKRWPNFAYGQSVEGELEWRDGKLAGRATVQCPHWLQQVGDQSRRVLGGVTGPLPPFTLTISELGELKQRDVDRKLCIQYFEGQGRVEFGGRTVTVPVQCVPRMQPKPPDRAVPALALEVFFTVKGKDLGLTDLAADEIDVRVGMRGTFALGAPAKRK
jgi:hypothetical protein